MNYNFYAWQHEQRDELLRLKEEQRLAHAYLFHGLPGLGKFYFAEAFSALLLCESPKYDRACEECSACHLLRAQSHPDYFLIEAEKAGAAIKVDQIRALTDFINKTAQRGGYRFIVIKDADAMNISSSNALLKSLEEPGDKTILILVSGMPDSLLPTIRSRCRKLSFPVPSLEQGLTWLNVTIPNELEAQAFLKEANMSPLLALENFSDEHYQDKPIILSDLQDLLLGKAHAVGVAGKWKDYPTAKLLSWWYEWALDLIKLSNSGEAYIRNERFKAAMLAMSEQLSSQAVYGFVDQLVEHKAILARGGNPNVQLLLEGLLLEWLKLRKSV